MEYSVGWLLKKLLGATLFPPLNGILLLLLGFALRRWRRIAWTLATLAVVLLVAGSLKPVGQWLLAPLEARSGFAPLAPAAWQGAGAIVVLGGGRYRAAPEYGEDTVTEEALSRLRYGAVLFRRSGLPVLVTGGRPDGGGVSEAEAMARILEREWQVPVRWREEGSDDTADNARESARLLKAAGIKRVLLVTHAYHMPRAQALFAAAGVETVPAATVYFSRRPLSPADWLPQAEGMRWVRLALHEWVGLLWALWRGA